MPPASAAVREDLLSAGTKMIKRRKNKISTEINITPFTDVVLVLLIIFMITTPMLNQSSLKVNLPKASLEEQSSRQETKNINITVTERGDITVDNEKVSITQLEGAVKQKLNANPERPVIISGDKNIKYEMLIKVIESAKKAGAQKFALSVELDKK